MKNKLEITLEEAKQLFSTSSKERKEIFIKKFGDKAFYTKITDRINTLEDAIEYLTEADEDVMEYRKMLKANIKGHTLRYQEVVIIVKALNEKWIPDWNNSSERKYWIWWKFASGFGFSDTGYHYDHTYTSVGSRLCFRSEELARYAGEKFLQKFKEFLTIS